MIFREVLETHFRSPEVWWTLAGRGTNVRRRRLNPEDFLDLEIPWPERAVQVSIREVTARALSIKKLRTETEAQLDAMLPAILDKAFKGEL
jgi:type I restriction enzyme S subunit